MNKKFSIFFAGIFVLAILLTMNFIFAISYDVAPSTALAGDTKSMLVFNVTNTSALGCGTSCNNLTLVTIEILGTATYTNVTSVNISDGTNDYSNGSITGSVVTIDVSNVQLTQETNLTISFTINSSSKYNVTLGAQVSAITNESNVSYSAVPYTGSNLSVTEATNPTATATCSDIYVGDAFPCTCSGTDSGVTASGVSTTSGSSTSGSITDTSLTGVFTYTCTVTDVAGNSASATKKYVVFTTGGGGGGGVSEQLPQKKHTLAKVTPGVVSIIKNFDPEIGVKQITIEVNNEAQNVKITVTKYDGKPAQVSKERSGKVYQYFEINTQNLGTKLDKAIVTIKVEKSWVSDEGLKKEEVLVFKFDESVEEWKELGTVYVEEDNTYYYYDVELDSFSFFAISAKTLAEKTGEAVGGIGEKVTKKSSFLWVVLIVLAALAAWFYLFKQKKKINP